MCFCKTLLTCKAIIYLWVTAIVYHQIACSKNIWGYFWVNQSQYPGKLLVIDFKVPSVTCLPISNGNNLRNKDMNIYQGERLWDADSVIFSVSVWTGCFRITIHLVKTYPLAPPQTSLTRFLVRLGSGNQHSWWFWCKLRFRNQHGTRSTGEGIERPQMTPVHSVTQFLPLVLSVPICAMRETYWLAAEAPGFEVVGIIVCTKSPQLGKLTTGWHAWCQPRCTCCITHHIWQSRRSMRTEHRNYSSSLGGISAGPNRTGLAGSCQGAAGWVYELLAAVCDMSSEFLFLCVNVLWAVLQCVWHFTV